MHRASCLPVGDREILQGISFNGSTLSGSICFNAFSSEIFISSGWMESIPMGTFSSSQIPRCSHFSFKIGIDSGASFSRWEGGVGRACIHVTYCLAALRHSPARPAAMEQENRSLYDGMITKAPDGWLHHERRPPRRIRPCDVQSRPG